MSDWDYAALREAADLVMRDLADLSPPAINQLARDGVSADDIAQLCDVLRRMFDLEVNP